MGLRKQAIWGLAWIAAVFVISSCRQPIQTLPPIAPLSAATCVTIFREHTLRNNLSAAAAGAAADELEADAARLRSQGLYADMMVPLRKALPLRIQAEGEKNLGLVNLLELLSEASWQQNEYQKTAEQLDCAISIVEPHIDSPLMLRQLARLRQLRGAVALEQRNYALAETNYRSSIEIFKGRLGWTPMQLSFLYSSLGDALVGRQQYDPAREYFEQALHFQLQDPNKWSDAAETLNSLGLLLLQHPTRPDFERAGMLLEQSLQTLKAHHEPLHRSFVGPLSNLALLRIRQGRFPEGLKLAKQVLVITEQRLQREASVLPDARRRSLLRGLRRDEQNLYAAVTLIRDPSWQRLALAVTLIRKGRALDLLADSVRSFSDSPPPIREKFQRVRELQRRYASSAYAFGGFDTHVDDPSAIAAEIDQLNTELALHLKGQRSTLDLSFREPNEIIDRVRAKLPLDSALIEIVQFNKQDLTRPAADPSDDLPHYLAFVLFPDGELIFEELGKASEIDALVEALQCQLSKSLSDPIPAAKRLYDVVIKPLGARLLKQQSWLISLDGRLALIPFAALHDGQDYLVRKATISMLRSGRDLLRPRTAEAHTDALLLANPEYRGTTCVRNNLSSLPASSEEAKEICARLATPRMLTGPQADKQSLLQAKSPGLLFIGSHGLWMDDDPMPHCRGIEAGNRSMTAMPLRTEDPLVRSALALAGLCPEERGGVNEARSVVTASELLGMNLWGSQMVVLSSCQSGLGRVEIGQGINGLTAALLASGAETVVASLWMVNDLSTRMLMSQFITNVLDPKISRAEALRKASLHLMMNGYPHPVAWAPFLVIGEAGVLRGSLAGTPPKDACVTHESESNMGMHSSPIRTQ
jgi:CHAT domain-containing protein